MTMRIAAALVVAVLALGACEDDGASVRDLGGSASSGSGSGSGSGSATGAASGSGTETAAAECAEPETDGGIVVTLDDFTLVAEEKELTSGPTRFLARNLGEVTHELVVVQSPNVEQLPLDENGAVDEEAIEPKIVAEVEEVPAGETCSLEVDLEPATYVLLCNIVDEGEAKERSHFLRGMRDRVKVS